jgi:hypothetical protein
MEISMTTSPTNSAELPIQLGDGLILRRSTAEDADALADFNARIHSDEGPEKPDEKVWAWTHDLMARPHPTFRASDFTLVEESRSRKIVSAMNLIPQTWTYAGIPINVGRPELVGTLPEYRHRGLVRKQFDIIHQWSVENGDLLQAITGIPYYYRLFGYEMAMNLHGGRIGYPVHIPRLKEGEKDPFHIRPAVEGDIPFLSQLYQQGCTRSLVACVWDDNSWRYEIGGKSDKNVNRAEVRIIETPDGSACGFLAHPPFTWGEMMAVQYYEIKPGTSWLEVTHAVIRYLEATYQLLQPDHGEKKPFGGFGFWLGEDHPVYHTIPDLLPRIRKPYAWYLRLPDMAAFLRKISPVLESRLENSPVTGYTGEVKLTFYQDGVRLLFEHGKISTIEPWRPTPFGHSGQAGFPPNTFLQLLFGYRSLEMLKTSFVDCWTDGNEIQVLLDSLFPRQPSNVWPIS